MDGTSARERRPNGHRGRGRVLQGRPFGYGRSLALGRDGGSQMRHRRGRRFGYASGNSFRRGLRFLGFRGLEIRHLKPVQAAQLDGYVFID
jgi:hypothetical protein